MITFVASDLIGTSYKSLQVSNSAAVLDMVDHRCTLCPGCCGPTWGIRTADNFPVDHNERMHIASKHVHLIPPA